MSQELEELGIALQDAYAAEENRLRQLEKARVTSGEQKNARILRRMVTNLPNVIARLRTEDSKSSALALAADFVKFGAKAVLLVGAQRGGDFLNNQLRGRWAERVVLSMKLDKTVILPFGPSGAAMPGAEDHRQTVMTYREISLLEGKRPDLLAFDSLVWEGLDAGAHAASRAWPERVLNEADISIVRRGKFAIEVKNSAWHYSKRRTGGGGPLSITVKKEEVREIQEWEKQRQLPVLFFQVLFDEVYCMSFRRMLEGIKVGYIYKDGDYQLDKNTGNDGKVFHRFHLDDLRHRCASVRFPSESLAKVEVLKDGNVVPHTPAYG